MDKINHFPLLKISNINIKEQVFLWKKVINVSFKEYNVKDGTKHEATSIVRINEKLHVLNMPGKVYMTDDANTT